MALLCSSLPAQTLRFECDNKSEAEKWQANAREHLQKLMMGGGAPKRVPLDPRILSEETRADRCTLQELSIQTLADRRVHAWLLLPGEREGKTAAVLALHGHGGKGEQVVRGQGLYWYGLELARRGYVVIAPDISSHSLQHTNWTLMGERTWDALRCLDYVSMLPEVDRHRLAVAGLSLGGETTMYVAALDERIKAACSSGWLTTTRNMRNGHCPCWNFAGLEMAFDFADIFSCVAPRELVLELGEKERAPGGFPVPLGESAFAAIQRAYSVLKASDRLKLTIHSGGHVFVGTDFWPALERSAPASPPRRSAQPTRK